MEVLIEDKKKRMHNLIDKIEDNDSIDRVLALLELSSLKIDRDPKRGLTSIEARKLSKDKINEWWGK